MGVCDGFAIFRGVLTERKRTKREQAVYIGVSM
jgi:hypothetical protein